MSFGIYSVDFNELVIWDLKVIFPDKRKFSNYLKFIGQLFFVF